MPLHDAHHLPAKLAVDDSYEISGYASLFGEADQGGDVVVAGAYARSLKAMAAKGQAVKMLWQHDPREPIGIWDEVREDRRGLFVKGRLLKDVARARDADEAGGTDGGTMPEPSEPAQTGTQTKEP